MFERTAMSQSGVHAMDTHHYFLLLQEHLQQYTLAVTTGLPPTRNNLMV